MLCLDNNVQTIDDKGTSVKKAILSSVDFSKTVFQMKFAESLLNMKDFDINFTQNNLKTCFQE
jgi:hypothetical protein